MSDSRERLHELDGLRGLLALYVAIYHLSAPLIKPGMALAWVQPWVEPAWFCVDMFFVMSGFVMAHVYGQAFQRGARAAELGEFFKARVARLYPVHLFALGVMVVFIVPYWFDKPAFTSPDGRFAWTAGLASLLMLHGPWIDHRTWNYPAWSISAEWHAYLLFPLIAPAVARLRSSGLLLTSVLCVALPFAVYQFGLASEAHPTNGPMVLARVLPLFTVGVVAWHARQLPVMRSTAVACLAFGLTPVLLLTGAASAAAVLLTPLILLSALGHPVVRRVLSHPAAVWLGSISYSLYMTHALVEMIGVNLVMRRISHAFGFDVTGHAAASAALLVAATLTAIAFGAATLRWVETPGRRFVLRAFAGRGARAGRRVMPARVETGEST